MKKIILSAVVGLGVSAGAFAQELTKVPVHDKPVWQVVSGLPDAPGAPVVVRSLATNQPLGAFPVDTRFLSFGANGQIVTTSVNGELGYLPTSAVSRLYPVAPKPEVPPPGPESLEDLAEAYEEKVTGQAGVSLNARNSLVDKASAKSPGVGQGAVPTMPGGNFGGGTGVNPYGNQPGAALMTGGLPAVRDMANPQGTYMGGPQGAPGMK